MFPQSYWPASYWPASYWPKTGADVTFTTPAGRTRTVQIDPRLCEVPANPRERIVSASNRTRIVREGS